MVSHRDGSHLLVSNAANGAFLVSEKEVRRQARVEWLPMKRHLPLEPDARVQRYVQCIANNVIAELPPSMPNIEWEVVVFDEDQVNAFADPERQDRRVQRNLEESRTRPTRWPPSSATRSRMRLKAT